MWEMQSFSPALKSVYCIYLVEMESPSGQVSEMSDKAIKREGQGGDGRRQSARGCWLDKCLIFSIGRCVFGSSSHQAYLSSDPHFGFYLPSLMESEELLRG